MTTLTLFLGGPLDGQWIETRNGDLVYRHPVFTPFTTFVAETVESLTCTVFEYRRSYLRSGKQEYSVFIPLEGDFDMMARLLEGYKPYGKD